MNTEWRPIEFKDVPSRAAFKELTLNLLRNGMSNSDAMRHEISRQQKLIQRTAT
jgi:hypothetical protein